MGNPHRVGIVGLGVISQQYLTTFAGRTDVVVTAVADLNTARADEVAAELGAQSLTVAELVASPDVDVVLNLTIPAAHAEIALAAIAAGKKVYGEKPLAAVLPDAVGIISAGDAAGVVVGSAPDTVLGTGIQTARAAIDDGRIGMPIAASAVMVTPGHERWHPNPDFYYREGGGPLLDMGPYYVSALVQLLGPVRSVIGSASRIRDTRVIGRGPREGESVPVDVDTHVTGVLEHVSGALSTITTSFDSVATKSANIEVHGSTGSLVVPDPNRFDGDVELRELGATEWVTLPASAGYTNAERGIGLIDMLEATEDRAPRASGEFALHVLEVMTSLLDSAHSGARVQLTTTTSRPSLVPLT